MMGVLADLLVSAVVQNPQVAPLTVLVIVVAYHLKYGVVAELRDGVNDLRMKFDGAAVILYRLAKESNETDAEAVRDVLWDNGRTFPNDFDHEGRYVGRRPPGTPDPRDSRRDHPDDD